MQKVSIESLKITMLFVKLWDECLDTKLDTEMRARITGVKAQMLDFNYFFGVDLGERLFLMTDNLSRTLQQTRMSAVQGQQLAELTKQTIQKMRTDDDFEDFFCLVKKKADSLQTEISEPSLPRRRKAPKRSEIGDGDPYFPLN